MFVIRMDENDVQNLLQFLDRVQLQGLNEVAAMNQILNSINEKAKELGKDKK